MRRVGTGAGFGVVQICARIAKKGRVHCDAKSPGEGMAAKRARGNEPPIFGTNPIWW